MSRLLMAGIINQKQAPYVPPAPEPVGPEMIMTWDTTNTSAGSSTSLQINLPLRGEVYWYDPNPPGFDFVAIPASTYDFWVDWGDGNGWSDHITGYTDSNKLHTYGIGGIKTVKVKGQFGSFHFGGTGDRNKLTDISQFDSMIFDCGFEAFSGCENLNFTATDAPVLALTKSTILDRMFSGALTFDSNINHWNVSNATRMNGMFATNGGFGTPMIFNQPLGSWNMSNVIDIGWMFSNNDKFNQNIGAWDVSNVQWMRGTFYYNSLTSNPFNNGGSPSISGWTTSSVTDMWQMFDDCIFNQDIGAWDVSNVTNMDSMFYQNPAFNNGGSPSISGWTTSAVTDMNYMFGYTNAFNQPIGSWDVSNVTDMNHMFIYSNVFNQDVGAWNTAKVLNMNGLFQNAPQFANGGSPSMSGWTTSGVTNMAYMLAGTNFNQPIGAWDVSNVTDMNNMFRASSQFNNGGNPNISNWDVSKVVNFSYMFYAASGFNQPLSGWTLNSVSSINMTQMFRSATVFNQDIGAWDVSKVTNMSYMFAGRNFNNGGSPSISGWTTSAVTNMSYMFDSNQYFAQNINAWDVSNVQTMYYMFRRNPANQAYAFDYSLYNWQPLSLAAGASTGLGNFMYPQPYNYMSTDLYNQLLINWSALGGIPLSITAYFGQSTYSGATATAARGILTGKGWNITDGGAV